MKEFNPELTATFDYDELQKLMGRKNLSFSIFKDAFEGAMTPEKWTVIAPDVLSEKPVFKGEVEFYSKYWRICDDVPVVTEFATNPTWKDIVDIASKMTGSDYLFLEGFRNFQKTENGFKMEIVFGS